MLILNRNLQPYEVMTCKLTGKMIVYGDYYYEDTDDNTVVLAREYHKLKQKAVENKPEFQEQLNKAKSEQEYKNMLIEAERAFLNETILDREIAHNGSVCKTGLSEWEDE